MNARNARTIGAAMVAQLDRVNGGVVRTETRIAELEEEIKRLQMHLHNAHKKIREQEHLLELATPAQDGDDHLRALITGQTYKGRPVIDMKEAAKRAGVSLATASRYLQSSYWDGVQQDNGRWRVYLDQPLQKKPEAHQNKRGRKPRHA